MRKLWEKICKKCKKTFKQWYNISKKEWEWVLYCSHSCANSVNMIWSKRCIWRIPRNKWKESLRGKENPQYTRIEKKCLVCWTQFVVKKYREESAKFCCKKCSEIDRNKWMGTEANKIRQSIEWKLWKDSVWARDWYMCKKCNMTGIEIHSHHIMNFAKYPELRFAIDNWITLCKVCHKRFHNTYWIKNNTKTQIDGFLNQCIASSQEA